VQSVAGVMAAAILVPPQPSAKFFIVALPIVIILGDVLHRWLELPCIRLGKRIVDRRSLRQSESSAQALILGAQPEGGLPRGDLGQRE
jgi:peptidoglycan/LPS O-acetylase OafA/YrhL